MQDPIGVLFIIIKICRIENPRPQKKFQHEFAWVGLTLLVGWWPLLIHLAVGRCFLFFVFIFLIFNFTWLLYAWPDLSIFFAQFSFFILRESCLTGLIHLVGGQ